MLNQTDRFTAAHRAARIFALSGLPYPVAFRRALTRVDGRDIARAYAEDQCHQGRALLATWLKADGSRREMPCVVRPDSRDLQPHLLPVQDLDSGECRFVNLDTLSGFLRINDPSELPPMPTAPEPDAPALTRHAPDRAPAPPAADVRPRFPLGRTVATPGAIALGVDLGALLRRHAAGDWGDVGADDARANDADVGRGGRLLSAYQTAAGRVWVITEGDRSATTALLPSEY